MNNTTTLTLSSSSPVQLGDLVLLACDGESAGGDMSVMADTSYAPTSLGPSAVPAPLASGGLEAELFYGLVVAPPPGPGVLNLTVHTAAQTGFLDCSMNVYRGGSPNVTLVGSDNQAGGNTGPVDDVACGPVATQPGGVALYVAVIYTCAGVPLDVRFTQRSGVDGNPDGDVAPTDGSPVSTHLQQCNASTGYWVCLTASFSP